MKKVIFSLVAIVTLGLAANTVKAQQAIKIGYFDIDQMVSLMPEMKTVVQPKIEAFQKDTLGPEHDNLEFQYNRADSIYKADSLAKKAKAVLAYSNNQRQQFAYKLINWQQIVQNATQQKYAELSAPYYKKVVAALKKVTAANKVNVVLKPGALEVGTDEKVVINLFIPVAKALGIDLNAKQAAGAQ